MTLRKNKNRGFHGQKGNDKNNNKNKKGQGTEAVLRLGKVGGTHFAPHI